MDPRIDEIFSNSITQEKKVAQVYNLFAILFPDDFGFWSTLADEEENHAALLQSGWEHFFEEGLFPAEALDPDLANIHAQNLKLDDSLALYQRSPPERKSAFMFALTIEGTSGEYYFQLAIDSTRKSKVLELFRYLVGQEIDHAKRIVERYSQTK